MPAQTERKAKLGVLVLVVVGGLGRCPLSLLPVGRCKRFEGGIVDENFRPVPISTRSSACVRWQDIMFGTDMEAILRS